MRSQSGDLYAGKIYRVWLEEVLGFQRRGDALTISPVVPKDWPGFRMHYRYQRTEYYIAVENGGILLCTILGGPR